MVYYQTLAVTAMTALAGDFLGGWLSSRVPLGRLMGLSQIVLAGGVLALPCVSTFAHVMGWAAAMGIGGGIVMVLFFSVWGRLFGRLHLGRIQGVAHAMTVVASAIGPVLLAWGLERTGSHAAVFQGLAVVITLAAVAALRVPLPDAPRSSAPPRVTPPADALGLRRHSDMSALGFRLSALGPFRISSRAHVPFLAGRVFVTNILCVLRALCGSAFGQGP